MSVVLWIITGLALIIGAAVVLLVLHGARQVENHHAIVTCLACRDVGMEGPCERCNRKYPSFEGDTMNEPRVRFNRGGRTEVLTVDYTAVMHQAVENERQRVLREVRSTVAKIRTTERRSGSYSESSISAATYKSELETALNAIEESGGSQS